MGNAILGVFECSCCGESQPFIDKMSFCTGTITTCINATARVYSSMRRNGGEAIWNCQCAADARGCEFVASKVTSLLTILNNDLYTEMMVASLRRMWLVRTRGFQGLRLGQTYLGDSS